MTNDPLMFALTLAEAGNTKAWLHIKSVLVESDYLRKDRVELCEQVCTDQSSKVCTYLTHNPTLEIGTVYTGCVVPEFKRIVYTRFRLSAHDLKVETGRWARLTREERECDCTHGGVQDERHVIEDCTKMSQLRCKYIALNFTVTEFYKDV